MPFDLSTPWSGTDVSVPAVTVPAPPPPALARVRWSGTPRPGAPIVLTVPWQGSQVRTALPKVPALPSLAPTPVVPAPRPSGEAATQPA
jgi:hypothetical protein